MKQIIPAYTFNAVAKTITLTDFSTIRLDRLLLIVNVTRNIIYYNFADATLGATVATNVITLVNVSTAGHDNADKLEIFYDTISEDPDYLTQQPISSLVTPSWTDNISILAITTLARNAVSRTTFDWRTKWGGYVFIRLGRGGTAALTSGVYVLLRRTLNNGAFEHVVGSVQFASQTIAAVSTTCTAAGSPNNAGVTSLTVASTTGFAAGDLILIQDTSPPTVASEWCRVARVVSSTVLLLDAPTISDHNNVAHTVRNKADIFVAWIEGGALNELIIDYGAPTTGDTITIEAWAQTLDKVVHG